MAKRPRIQLDAFDSIEGTRFSGEASTQARPPRSKPDGIGELVSRGGLTHLGRKVVANSPPRSPLSGDPGPGQIQAAAGGNVDAVRTWAGSTQAGPTLQNALKNARRGGTGSVGSPL